MDKADYQRRLDKINEALISAQIYFERQSEASAALHNSDSVLYSPIVATLEAARNDLKAIIAESRGNSSS